MVQKENLKVIVICGPTAAGKTAAAIELAQKIDAEIISADSGQIYCGMDIGTAKPTLEERGGIPFHLIDILNPDQRFSAADFRKRALEKISEIQSRDKKVILAGGTGLYLQVLERGIFEGPSADPEVRKGLGERCRLEGVESLHQELKKIDPVAAQKIPSRNRQRIIRALEVYRVTGRPISEFWDEHRRGGVPPPGCEDRIPPFLKIGLALPRDELGRRINERVDRMMRQGWIEETDRLLKEWGSEAPGLQIIGYKELVSHLTGKIKRGLAIELIKTHTRQYAKRQATWFRKDREIRWVTDLSEVSV